VSRAALYLLFSGLAGLASAQQLQPGDAPSEPGQGAELRVYSLAVHSAYYSDPRYAGFSSSNNPGERLIAGGNAAVGATLTRSRWTAGVIYTLSFLGTPGRLSQNSFNHFVSVKLNRSLGNPRWKFRNSVVSEVVSLQESLFRPVAFQSGFGLPESFDQIASTVLAGSLTNPQVASLLTGAPLLDAPTRRIYLGDRFFNAGAQATLSYSVTPRVSLSFGGQGSYMKTLDSAASGSTNLANPAAPAGQAYQAAAVQVGTTYSLTPRTQFGSYASSQYTFAAGQSLNAISGAGFVSHNLTPGWRLSGRGGVGQMRPTAGSVSQFSSTPEPVYGGSIGFQRQTHAFMASVDRAVLSQYGYGGGAALTTTGGWTYTPRGARWNVYANAGQQRIANGQSQQLQGWQFAGGYNRSLTRHTSLSVTYSYMSITRGLDQVEPLPVIQGIRAQLVWSPGWALR
jgi:hypothetical protein